MASWADADAAYDAPELGPLDLAAAGFSRRAALPPLAVVFDSEPANRAAARRLVARGFPVAWFTHDAKNAVERGERLRGTRARTPRHAAEVAAHLPRASSRAGGDDAGGPHHASGRASRAAFRTLDALSLSDRDASDRTSAKSTNPFRANEETPRLSACEDAEDAERFRDDKEPPREDDADPESADDFAASPASVPPTATVDDDENNPLLVFFAVSGDAEVESALERLLAGEPVSYTHLTLPTKA